MMLVRVLLLLFLSWKGHAFSDSVVNFVISTGEAAKTREIRATSNNAPKIVAMEIDTNVANRFATTVVKTTVRNVENIAAQTTFSMILPKSAFISGFEMKIGNGIYRAQVEEKAKAKQIYNDAVSQGLSAGLVGKGTRNSETFDITLNIKEKSEIEFSLKYEELLQRKFGFYELVIDIRPGQIVDDLSVSVRIDETRPLKFVRTPTLRTGNLISNNKNPNPSAKTKQPSKSSAIVTFNPDANQQQNFAQQLGGSSTSGIAGQFIVEYDVERDPFGGEVLVNDGFFVHFFAPSHLTPLKKHIVFALDHSGSMYGKKIQQLTEAMQNILSQLTPNDLFDIVRFHSGASVWNAATKKFQAISIGSKPDWNNFSQKLKNQNIPAAIPATAENIQRAKNAVKDHSHLGATNMIAGLTTALFLIDRTEKYFPNEYQLIMVFLTDGMPNTGIENTNEIVNTVTAINKREHSTSIFSLSFGDDADKEFLRQLAAKNFGFSQHIFTAADAALQLTDFYERISSPLLKNVNFKYVNGVTNVVKTYSRMLFDGAEIVTTGRTSNNGNILVNVNARAHNGSVQFTAPRSKPVDPLERLWAYLTIQKLLEDRQLGVNVTQLTQQALDLSLKYSFVTPVTSLVVVHDKNYLEAVANNGPLLIDPRGFGEAVKGKTILDQSTPRPPRVPAWIQDMQGEGTISTPEGDLKFDPEQHATMYYPCDNSPSYTSGFCANVFDCPKAYSALIDRETYLDYFCVVNDEYAGVCCS